MLELCDFSWCDWMKAYRNLLTYLDCIELCPFLSITVLRQRLIPLRNFSYFALNIGDTSIWCTNFPVFGEKGQHREGIFAILGCASSFRTFSIFFKDVNWNEKGYMFLVWHNFWNLFSNSKYLYYFLRHYSVFVICSGFMFIIRIICFQFH